MVTHAVAGRDRLREDCDRFERVLEASGLGLWELDLDSGEFIVDGRCAAVLGYGAGELEASWATGVAIIHPDDAVPVSRVFEAHLRGETPMLEYETRMLTQARTWTWVAGRGRLIRDGSGRPTHISGTLKNIDAERAVRDQLAAAAQALEHQATHDPLTDLPNRRGFARALDALLDSARTGGRSHALCYLDLDHFKLLNDSCGHAAGDALLRRLPGLWTPALPPGAVLARLGGDEFALLLPDCALDSAGARAEALRAALRAQPFEWHSRRFTLDVSAGIARLDASSPSAAAALAAADAACYLAKERGPGRVHVSWPNDLALRRRRGEMRTVVRLKQALTEDRFRLEAMSVARLDGREAPRHHELLLRMTAPGGDTIAAGAFLPAAARWQLMPEIDRWVLRHAIGMLGMALPRNPAILDHRFGINLSSDSLDPALPLRVRQLLEAARVPGTLLYFELTETAAVANLALAAQVFRELRALGCQTALDDFGTGAASFAYLKQLPLDWLKVDGSFVRGLPDSRVDRAILRAVVDVARELGLRTVAEYVESDAVRRCCENIGLDYGQGWAIARPCALETLLEAPAALPRAQARS